MVTDIYIQSSSFPSYPNEEDDINPGRFGKSLAEYIRSSLEKNEISVADLYPTDYCYEIRIDQFKFPVYIMCGNLDGESEKFLISLEPKKEFVKKLLKKIPTGETLNKIISCLEDSFYKNPEVEIIPET